MYIEISDARALCEKIGVQQVPDSEVLLFIEKAEARINAVLGTRYALPLPYPTPSLIKSIAADFTASFIIDKYYSSIIKSKEQTVLSEVYFKRAENDLKNIVVNGLLDRHPGITVMNKPQEVQASPCMRSTKRGKSPIEEALSKW